MASSIPTSSNNPSWHSLRKEVRQEIMNTDILCEIVFPDGEAALAAECLEQAFTMMREFEARYSRFKEGNELWRLNQSEHAILSPEFFEILTLAKRYHEQTAGLFDSSILPTLHRAGYQGAPLRKPSGKKVAFTELTLDATDHSATKPADLLIDLGGIGKGYIVDQVARFLATRFENFLVDAGGDIFVKGVNQKENYPYWAIEVEHPKSEHPSPALLLLSDMAVATSGKNRRHWIQEGEHRHHLIDPTTQKSSRSTLLSVTVIAQETVTADVFAKTLFIAGKERGEVLAQQLGLPAIFIEDSGAIHVNHYAEHYVWKVA